MDRRYAPIVLGAALTVATIHASITRQVVGPLGPPPVGLDWQLVIPSDNPHTPMKIALGRALFTESLLSKDQSISCASCHGPARAFSDRVAVSRGARGARTRRNAPSLHNAGYRSSFFWDGRVTSLEEQVLRPIVNPDEMALTLDEAVARLNGNATYRASFNQVFSQPVDERRLGQALAAFVRTLRAGDSTVDRYLEGDVSALGVDAREGLLLFRGRANCIQCHMGPLLSDDKFHNTGVSWGTADLGRFEVTAAADDRGRFRTPSLRDVARTAPYMHDGSLETLEAVVEFYDRGGNRNPNLDKDIQPLRLTPDERRQLVAFLHALNSRTEPGR